MKEGIIILIYQIVNCATTLIIVHSQLEEIISRLKALEAQKEQIFYEIQKILSYAKMSGIDKDILKEILEIHKVQKESSLPKDDVHEGTVNLSFVFKVLGDNQLYRFNDSQDFR